EFSGTVAQVRAAFATDIRNYQIEGATYLANASNPRIPAALVPVVSGVVSLNNFPKQFFSRSLGVVKKFPGTGWQLQADPRNQSECQPFYDFNSSYPLG